MTIQHFRAAAAALIVALFSTSASAVAQVAPSPSPTTPSDPCGSILSIVTRPTQTTSTCTVRARHVLLETGYAITSVTGSGGGTTATFPQEFVRLGTGKNMEVSFSPPSFERSSVGGAVVNGSTDLNLGAKWELGYTDKAVWGANVQVSAPTGSSPLTAGRTQYTANANWGYTLTSEFSLAGTLGFNSLSGSSASGLNQSYFTFVPTLEITAAMPGNAQVFLDYAYFSSAGRGLGSKQYVDFGYQRAISPHAQFDVEFGFQPSVVGGQRPHSIGAGLSFMN